MNIGWVGSEPEGSGDDVVGQDIVLENGEERRVSQAPFVRKVWSGNIMHLGSGLMAPLPFLTLKS